MLVQIVKKALRILFYLIPSFIRKPYRAYMDQINNRKNRFKSKPRDYLHKILDGEKGNLLIKSFLEENRPVMISRIGETELKCVNFYLANRAGKEKKISFPQELLDEAFLVSGVYPRTNELFDEFCEIFIESIKSTDVMGVWFIEGEHQACNTYCPEAKLVGLGTMGPELFSEPWSEAFRGKKILAISPFADTIKSQYKNREHLFENPRTLPEFELKTYQAVQAMGGGHDKYDSWVSAYKGMCSDIQNIDFDIAIIGAGAFGLPLAAFIKKLGKKVIHTGGAHQLLFGIKGGRWDDQPQYRDNLYNEYWVRPTQHETPQNMDKITSYEGLKAYW